MPYAVADDVIRRYNPISSMLGAGSLQVSTVDIASVYIADGESIVNAFLARRYVLPLTNEPILTDLTSDIAVYRILSDRAPRIPDFMQTRYTNAMSLLTMLRDGGMDLTMSNTVDAGASTDQYAWSNVADPDGPLQNGPVFRPIESELCVASADRLTF